MHSQSAPCRLCDGNARYQFSHRILARYQAAYFQCQDCGSLFTEPPTWLDEAYSFPGTVMDVGSALRPLQNWLLLVTAFGRAGLDRTAPYIDFGANTGLLARLLRYSGYNFSSYEKYVVPYYSDYNHMLSLVGQTCYVMTAFEVFEHFAEPGREFGALFQTTPTVVIASTQLYAGQGRDWDYLSPFCGQHVFFYTAEAMAWIATKYGYDFINTPNYQLFVKTAARGDATISRLVTELTSIRFTKEATAEVVNALFAQNDFIAADYQAAVERFQRELLPAAGADPPAGAGAAAARRPMLDEIARLAQLAQQTEEENARLRTELVQLRQSTSWKLTAPLRWVRAGVLEIWRD
jgi:hypothetical protein